ncbi:ferredoxin-thioredoxin reductase catalytic domain-containing protein [Desulfohalovibrio reitneri]|uniref:ferredoxin-thioredoxin reductase catalytic domain-containing protein n=1 Tax=Desulfohalovibrio reitneri TaxID=1307759 RepID=UPI0004A6E884|nr:ferredoxin-thioredoxin reductase catalytic domain-containing protein [Desulfohalovibrio reitneri]
MDAKQLYEKLKPLQEKQGYQFNKDMTYTMPLLESLLVNKERHGYMACPCRLATGEYEKDRDIICPCTYRGPDVEEYGACFCALYVSDDYNQERMDKKTVPERRPPEKVMEALEANLGGD